MWHSVTVNMEERGRTTLTLPPVQKWLCYNIPAELSTKPLLLIASKLLSCVLNARKLRLQHLLHAVHWQPLGWQLAHKCCYLFYLHLYTQMNEYICANTDCRQCSGRQFAYKCVPISMYVLCCGCMSENVRNVCRLYMHVRQLGDESAICKWERVTVRPATYSTKRQHAYLPDFTPSPSGCYYWHLNGTI